MPEYPKLERHLTGCPLCGSPDAEYGVRGWKVHELPWTVYADVRRCRASGLTTAGVDRVLRSFVSTDSFDDPTARRSMSKTIELLDEGDSISLASQVEIQDTMVAEVIVWLGNKDLPRFIDELTRIARDRGLIEKGN